VELRALVRSVRADVAVAHDEIMLGDCGGELRPRMKAVARIEHRRELRVHFVRRAELAVQVPGDRATERIAVIGREAERRDRVARAAGGVREPRGLGALAGAVDAFDCEKHAHRAS
jgi:hypothetical protein